MAEINLRTYIQEIDDLIEEGQNLEEAIAHCRHILKTYPKHIDTYRLLGKAYLESKRFGDAGDIFQRVLSAIPHDFVSHIGMAIIREDEGNLDAAIWHMERGSEAQPGNAAIEEEIKRLVGKRDGIEPQRVRPTRGALARMYYHGELYSYAVSELQTALEEDPDRPDLQLLLADTFWRTDQKLEAANLCGQILEKLPYCFLANQITAALLQASGKPEESAINLRRLIALDPYMAFIETPMDNPATIDSSAIKLEKLHWRPGQPLPSSETTQPDWAASLGVDLRGEEAKAADREDMPSWLKSPGPPDQEASPIHPFAGAKAPPGTEIPDWMREAGWVEGNGEATDGPSDVDEIYETEEGIPHTDQPLQRADLPSWLSEISPEKPISKEATPVSEPPHEEDRFPADVEESDELPEWIQEITPSASEGEAEPLGFAPEEELEMAPSEAKPPEPEFLAEPDIEGMEEILSEDESPEAEIPEYPPWLEPSTPGATDTIVGWLGDKKLQDVSAADDIPNWMRGTGPLVDPTLQQAKVPDQELSEEPGPEFASEPEGIPEISKDLEVPVPSKEIPASDLPIDEPAPAWLDESKGFDDEPVAEASEQLEEAPDWLSEATMKEEDVSPLIEEAAPPSWLEDFDEETEDEAREELGEPEITLEAFDQPPNWLSEVISEDVLEGKEIEEKPEWLEGVVEPESILGEEIPPDIEEAPDWLSEMSLVEEVDTSPVTEEKEEPPEWLKGLTDSEISATEEEPIAEETPPEWVTEESFPEAAEEIVAGEETPEWLEELSEPSSMVEEPSDVAMEPPILEALEEPVVEAETPPEAETPDWLEELSEPSSMVEEPVMEAETPPEAETPDWLEELSEPSSMVEEPVVEAEAPPEAETPEWLEELSEPSSMVEEPPDVVMVPPALEALEVPVAEAEAPPEAETPDWLEELSEPYSMVEEPPDVAMEPPASEALEEPVVEAETPPEAETPDWLMDLDQEAMEVEPAIGEGLEEPIAPASAEEALAQADVPEWLKGIETTPGEAEAVAEEPISEIPEPMVKEEAISTDEILIGSEEAEATIISEELLAEETAQEAPEPAEEIAAIPAEEAPDWLQEMVGAPAEEVAIEEPIQELDEPFTDEEFEAEAEDWLKEISEAPAQIEPSPEEAEEEILEPASTVLDYPEDEAPVWLEEIEEIEPEVISTSEEAAPETLLPIEDAFEIEEVPEEIKEIEEDIIQSESVEAAIPADIVEEFEKAAPIEAEEPDRFEEAYVEEVPEDEAVAQETPEWLQEIELRSEEAVSYHSEDIEQIEEPTWETEITAEEIEKEEPQWRPEFVEEEAETVAAAESIEEMETEVPKAALEESFDWLEESALEVAPEPEQPLPPMEPSYTREQVGELIESIEDPLDDDEVFSFLEGLAARDTTEEVEVPTEEQALVEPILVPEVEEEKIIEDHAIPEELDESLDWLEQLAAEEPIEDFSPPIFVEGLEEEEADAEIPDWLEEVAEKPERAPEDEGAIGEQISEEVAPSISELSSLETVISKRPSEEKDVWVEPLEEHPEEKLTEPMPSAEPVEERDEWVWLQEGEEEPPKAEAAASPAPSPEAAPEEIISEEVESREEVAEPIEEPVVDPQIAKLNKARHALDAGEIEAALSFYSDLIEEKAEIDAVIQDLRTAIEKTPREPMLWQILGDALMKAGHLSDAIEAYRRGMEAV